MSKGRSMLIVKKTKRVDGGGVESTWSLSEEQVNYLLTWAINNLLDSGLARVDAIVDGGSEAMVDLVNIDISEMEVLLCQRMILLEIKSRQR